MQLSKQNRHSLPITLKEYSKYLVIILLYFLANLNSPKNSNRLSTWSENRKFEFSGGFYD